MIHSTPFGYPPRTPMELGQDAAEAVMAAEDKSIESMRFMEAPGPQKQDAVQSIVRHCFEAQDEYAKRCAEMELTSGGDNAMAVVMAQAEYIGFVGQTLRSILEECRRLT